MADGEDGLGKDWSLPHSVPAMSVEFSQGDAAANQRARIAEGGRYKSRDLPAFLFFFFFFPVDAS